MTLNKEPETVSPIRSGLYIEPKKIKDLGEAQLVF